MLGLWVEAGQDPSQFWGKTLRIIHTVLKASAERERKAHNDRAWLAHQTAFLTKYAPDKPKKFPKLSTLQIKPKQSKAQGWEADFAAVSAWASRGRN